MLRSSAYLDMLHDRPRASAYARALKVVLLEQKRKGKESLFVLEIGAGSGLLSCLAAQTDNDDDALAVSVVACEQFPPMAKLARRVLEDNGLDEGKVRVLCCRSEDLEVDRGRGQQQQRQQEGNKKFLLPARADVVVSEILDSLLVGEGVLPVMHDVSSRRIMREDAVAIPCRGRVLVQAVRCRALGLAGAASGGSGEEGGGGGRSGGKRQQRRCCKGDGGSRCPVPLHLDPLYLSEELFPLGEPAVLFDLDLARPGAKDGGGNGEDKDRGDRDKDGDDRDDSGVVAVVETSTVELFPECDDDDTASPSPSAFDALALWWQVDLAPGVSLSTAPCWAGSSGSLEEKEGGTDHWMSCWVPVPLCRRRRRKNGQKGPFVVRGVIKDTEISVQVLPPEESEEEAPEEQEEEEEEQGAEGACCPCCSCSVPTLYSPSGDWGWGTARGSPAALLLERGAEAAAARAAAAAAAAAARAAAAAAKEKEERDGAATATILVLGDGHGAARAAAAAASAASAGRKTGNDLRVLALQPSHAGCRAVERFAAVSRVGSSSSSSSPGRVVVEARTLSDFLSPPSSSSVPSSAPPAVALLAEPHYRAAEACNLPWRLLDFWPRRDELVERGLLLPTPLSAPASSAPPSPASPPLSVSSSVTSPARASVVVAAISCPLLSRNYNGELREVEGVSMRLVDEAFRRGIGGAGAGAGGAGGAGAGAGAEQGRGARALFARPLWQVKAKEVSPRAVLFSSRRKQLDISAERASEVLPASDEVELDVFAEGEEGEVVHGVACWLRFEAAAAAAANSEPAAAAAANSEAAAKSTTEPTTAVAAAADFWAPDPSGAPCPGSQAILLFHEPWRRGESNKNKKVLRVRVTLSLDEQGKKVDGEVVAF